MSLFLQLRSMIDEGFYFLREIKLLSDEDLASEALHGVRGGRGRRGDVMLV